MIHYYIVTLQNNYPLYATIQHDSWCVTKVKIPSRYARLDIAKVVLRNLKRRKYFNYIKEDGTIRHKIARKFTFNIVKVETTESFL